MQKIIDFFLQEVATPYETDNPNLEIQIETICWCVFYFLFGWVGNLWDINTQPDILTKSVCVLTTTFFFLVAGYRFFSKPENYSNDNYFDSLGQIAVANAYVFYATIWNLLILITLTLSGHIDFILFS